MRLLFAAALLVLIPCGCVAKGARNNESNLDLGVVPVGAVPVNRKAFKSTDCWEQGAGFSDCSAQDYDGRRYAFFDGALSRVSARKGEVSDDILLPGGIRFGEDIHEVAKKAELFYKVKFDLGEIGGILIYASDYKVRSISGVFYSIELVADKNGNLIEFTQRTDF